MSESAATARAPATDITVKLRPTLFVGIGGTGKEILLRLRRRILQNDWGGKRIDDLARFPIASFVYFDTDTTDAVESDRSQISDPLAKSVRFTEGERLQARVDVRRYMPPELENYPLVQAWLPEGDLSSINTEKGAGQVRAISRVLFFDQFVKLQRLLREQSDALLNSVGRQHDLAHLHLDIESELRVVVVCSAAGGTGSGSFIDFGLALRSQRNPRPAQTDLILLLPGGFKGANYQRVNANTFAALMELEHAMRPNAQPPYVGEWANREGPRANIAPYDDVYLLDTRNVLGAGTDKVDEIYDMAADILFEDFGSSDFSSRKRSISVNQQQFKMVSYYPPLSPRVGARSLSYSNGFSAFGQATIDTKGRVALDMAIAESAKAMLQSYFNVATGDSGRLPTLEERDRFLADQFLLTPAVYEETIPGAEDAGAITEPALVERLLLQEDGESVTANLAAQIHRDYESEVFHSTDLSGLPGEVLRLFEARRADVTGSIEHNAEVGPAGTQIVAARRRLAQTLKGGTDAGVRATLFRYLDNRARGGLDYTIKLVEDANKKLEEAGADLAATEDRYRARAEQARQLFERSLENLKEALQNRFLRGPDRKAAERYQEHLKRESTYHLTMLLRAQAAGEAAKFLAEMAADLGTVRGVDLEGRTVWDGAIATLVEGRALVEKALGSFDTEVSLLRNAVAREDAGVWIVLPDADADTGPALSRTHADIEAWAQDIFQNEGGSRTLFPVLKDDVKRNELLNKLRGYARKQLAPRADKLRSIHDILASMTPPERQAVFRKAMVRAMPWLNARFDHLGDGMAMGDRYKLLIAVENNTRFRADFDAEIKQVIPTGQLGLQSYEIVNSGLRNRIIVYCELSGIPLDSIRPLGAEWRSSYRSELSSAFPLHNHRDFSRFPSPVVPSNTEIEEVRRTMGLFVRAVCFGVITHGGAPDVPYQLRTPREDSLDVGSERTIRAGGFPASHQARIEERVERFERALTPLQVLAAAALLEWTGRRAYAARIVKIGQDQTDRVPGLVQTVAMEIERAYRMRFRAMAGSDAVAQPDLAREALRDAIGTWTEEVPGSVEDTDPMDANRDPNASEASRAVDKRRIIPARFTPEALEALLQPMAAVPPPPRAAPAHAAGGAGPGGTSWRIAVNKEVSGPFTLAQMTAMAVDGRLHDTTNVLPSGSKTWVKVREVPQLLELTEVPPPPDDDIPPPPDD